MTVEPKSFGRLQTADDRSGGFQIVRPPQPDVPWDGSCQTNQRCGGSPARGIHYTPRGQTLIFIPSPKPHTAGRCLCHRHRVPHKRTSQTSPCGRDEGGKPSGTEIVPWVQTGRQFHRPFYYTSGTLRSIVEVLSNAR